MVWVLLGWAQAVVANKIALTILADLNKGSFTESILSNVNKGDLIPANLLTPTAYLLLMINVFTLCKKVD